MRDVGLSWMRRGIPLVFAYLLTALSPSGLFAHHAMEFIDLDGYTTALRGQGIFHLHFDYFVSDPNVADKVHWEITPGLSYGITDRLLADFHTHLSYFGPPLLMDGQAHPPFFEAWTISTQMRFGEEGQYPLDPAIVLSFESPYPKAKDLLGSRSLMEATLVLSKSFGTHRTAVLNLTAEKEADLPVTFSWGFGAKTPLGIDPHGPGMGVEFKGTRMDDVFTLLGFYLPVNATMVLKTGFGFGMKEAEDRLRFHLSLFTSW